MESSQTCKSNLSFLSVSVQDFLEKAKKVFEEKWVVNPKVSGFHHQIRPVGLFTFVFSSMGFLSHWEIFRGIFCKTLKSGPLLPFNTNSNFNCDFNILQMKQSSKLGLARFDSLCIFWKITNLARSKVTTSIYFTFLRYLSWSKSLILSLLFLIPHLKMTASPSWAHSHHQ